MCMFSQPKPPKPPEPKPADELLDETITGNRLAAAGSAREATLLTTPLSAGAHELALDRLQAQIQEIGADQERTLRLSPVAPEVEPLPAPVDGALLRARTAPDRLEWVLPASVGTLAVSPFMAQLLDDPDAASARATLELGSAPGAVSSVTLQPAGGALAGLAFSSAAATGDVTVQAGLAIQSLPEELAPVAAADSVAVYSAAATAHRRVKIQNLPVPPVVDGGITTAKLATAAVTAAKLAGGAAVQSGANAASGGGQLFLDRSGDTLRFRRLVVTRSVSGSGNAVADAQISIATAADTVTITLNLSKTYITPGTGGGGGGGGG